MRLGRSTRRRYGRSRRRFGVFVVAVAMTALFLVSCMAGSNFLWVRGLFGLDVSDYAAEPVERTLAHDGTVARTLVDTVSLVLGDSIDIACFRGSSQALKHYHGALLNGMLRENYAAYVGDPVTATAVREAYPTLSAAVLISEEALENAVYRYFGGTHVDHKTTDAFRHLARADCYTTPVPVRDRTVELEIVAVEETVNTYRLRFRLLRGEERSDVYCAIFVKRDDGPAYWKALELAD